MEAIALMLWKFRSSGEGFIDSAFDLADRERPALELVQADGLDAELRSQLMCQLAGVQLGDQDLPEALESVAGVREQWRQVTQGRGSHRSAPTPDALGAALNRLRPASPAAHQHVTGRGTIHGQLGDFGIDGGDL